PGHRDAVATQVGQATLDDPRVHGRVGAVRIDRLGSDRLRLVEHLDDHRGAAYGCRRLDTRYPPKVVDRGRGQPGRCDQYTLGQHSVPALRLGLPFQIVLQAPHRPAEAYGAHD